MDRTTIMLPPDLKIRASNQAKKEKISLGQFIRDALKKSLDSESRGPVASDSLFLDNAAFSGVAPRNLAADHDDYLYGEEQ